MSETLPYFFMKNFTVTIRVWESKNCEMCRELTSGRL